MCIQFIKCTNICKTINSLPSLALFTAVLYPYKQSRIFPPPTNQNKGHPPLPPSIVVRVYVVLFLLTGEDVVGAAVSLASPAAVPLGDLLGGLVTVLLGGGLVLILVLLGTLLLGLLVLLLLLLLLLLMLLGLLAGASAGPITISVVHAAALVGALSAVSVPFEVTVAHKVLHSVTAQVFAVVTGLADAGTIPNNVALVLGKTRAAEVLMTGHLLFVEVFWGF